MSQIEFAKKYLLSKGNSLLVKSDYEFLYKGLRLSLAQISDLTGMSMNRVRDKMNLHGLLGSRDSIDKNIDLHQQITESSLSIGDLSAKDCAYLYIEKGLSLNIIADLFDVSPNTALHFFEKYGIEIRRVGKTKSFGQRDYFFLHGLLKWHGFLV